MCCLSYPSPDPNFMCLWATLFLPGDTVPLEPAVGSRPHHQCPWGGSVTPCRMKQTSYPGPWITGTANNLHYSWKTGLSSRSLLPAAVVKHPLHRLHSLLGWLLICITMRELLPLPHQQRGFKHLPSGENRWFISLAGRKDWQMLNILYPGLWSYKASSLGTDHSEGNAFLRSLFPPVETIWSFPGCKQSCLCAVGKGCSKMGHMQLKPTTERMAGAWLNLIKVIPSLRLGTQTI